MKNIETNKRSVMIDERLLLIDNKQISLSEKVLLTFITHFLKNNDELFATNGYLAKRLNIHSSTVSAAITKFLNHGLIGYSKVNEKRHIYQSEKHLEAYENLLGTIEDHTKFIEDITNKKRVEKKPTKRAKTNEELKPEPQPIELYSEEPEHQSRSKIINPSDDDFDSYFGLGDSVENEDSEEIDEDYISNEGNSFSLYDPETQEKTDSYDSPYMLKLLGNRRFGSIATFTTDTIAEAMYGKTPKEHGRIQLLRVDDKELELFNN